MAKNLNYAATGSKCGGTDEIYKDDINICDECEPLILRSLENAETINCIVYGRLYSWSMAKTVCPRGLHLPDSTEWKELLEKFTENSEYLDNFAAMPGGLGIHDFGFVFEGDLGRWWSASESEIDNDDGWGVTYFNYDSTFYGGGSFDKFHYNSVRCLKDN